ncbi:hypothetical protein E2C01_039345 [Portunus trituberculatus]|uniref:Uncharacterized protein n=1 Tax=Portunus trituberculatus TaxID=210409 RepID=A0A5B7FKJ4_PORTR|nr:hypothetical protein [Portunus trituberculatus]
MDGERGPLGERLRPCAALAARGRAAQGGRGGCGSGILPASCRGHFIVAAACDLRLPGSHDTPVKSPVYLRSLIRRWVSSGARPIDGGDVPSGVGAPPWGAGPHEDN